VRSSRPGDTRVLDPLSMTCTLVYDDESAEILDVDVFSMRGAQRDEITGYLISQGYEPTGRWESRGSTLSKD
jgi:hypothetical protein